MRVSLGGLVARNWPIKLAAVFFAIMLYIAVAAQQPLTQSFSLQLTVTVPPGRNGDRELEGEALCERLLGGHRDVEHDREKDGRELDRPVPRNQAPQANAHR